MKNYIASFIRKARINMGVHDEQVFAFSRLQRLLSLLSEQLVNETGVKLAFSIDRRSKDPNTTDFYWFDVSAYQSGKPMVKFGTVDMGKQYLSRATTATDEEALAEICWQLKDAGSALYALGYRPWDFPNSPAEHDEPTDPGELGGLPRMLTPEA